MHVLFGLLLLIFTAMQDKRWTNICALTPIKSTVISRDCQDLKPFSYKVLLTSSYWSLSTCVSCNLDYYLPWLNAKIYS